MPLHITPVTLQVACICSGDHPHNAAVHHVISIRCFVVSICTTAVTACGSLYTARNQGVFWGRVIESHVIGG
jgi:hypothetical protein